jgi:hypothetical protein
MRRRIRRWSRRTMVMAAAIIVSCAGAVLPATAAQAAVPGLGWTASWNYYTDNALQFNVASPGARAAGQLTDNNGARRIYAAVEDSDPSGYCARAYVAVNDSLVSRTDACNETVVIPTLPATTGKFAIFAFKTSGRDGSSFVGNVVTIPDSSNDPGLRNIATATQWEYYTNDAFHYRVSRPGVVVEGYGTNQGPSLRSASSVVTNTESGGTCATGSTTDRDGRRAEGGTCTAGASAYFYRGDYPADITVEGCSTSWWGTRHCLSTDVGRPF